MKNRYYIENLTVYSWLFYILPHFLEGRLEVLQETKEIYYFNNSRLGLLLASLTLWFVKVRLKRVNFSQGDMRDQDSNLIWMKTMGDALSIQDDIKNNPEFQKVVRNYGVINRMQSFLTRCVIFCDLAARDTSSMLKLIFFIRIIDRRESFNDTIKTSGRNMFLFVRERPWLVELEKFAQKKEINIISTGALHFYIRIFFLQFDRLKSFIKQIMYYGMIAKYKMIEVVSFKKLNSIDSTENTVNSETNGLERSRARIMVEYYGHLNFDSPELCSDLFFVQESSLLTRDILIYFGLPRAPITNEEWNEIKGHGMSAVVINSRAAATPYVPVFKHKRRQDKGGWQINKLKDKKNIFIHKWLQHYVSNYHERYDYWVDFITQHNIKVHVTWHKYDVEHCAILDALQNTGGVGAVYQRSFEHFPTPWTFTTADVVFGFSEWGAHIGRDEHSIIPYYIIVGYLGDHRFGLLRKRADDVRNFLKNHGANRIVAYFDEHAVAHPRWDLAYKATLENYSYLLNKVLENPWFGLILKPKVPSTLRSRLGSVSELLRCAEKTGRCFVFEGGALQGSYPPAVASLGADVAIHGHFFAATAGIESALAGTPTLFLDAEGIPPSPLHNLRTGSVIFKDIDSLWRVCMEYWNGSGIPKFGDWSDILGEIDPFRDGRAAERMGTYLKWIQEGFEAKLSRETVLADAAERYCRIWGKDKILSVNCDQKIREHSAAN